MARNNNSERTVQRILDIAMQLFFEKGYEETTIQDIIGRLNGLSKGAIYHHFASKEEIFIAATNRFFEQDNVEDVGAQIRDDSRLNAMEKLQKLMMTTLADPKETAFRDLAVIQANTPRFLVSRMKRTVEYDAPTYIRPIIEQGVHEGLIQTAYPDELAQVVLLLVNIWVDPSVFHSSGEAFMRRAFFLVEMFEKYGGTSLMSGQLMQSLESVCETYVQTVQLKQDRDS